MGRPTLNMEQTNLFAGLGLEDEFSSGYKVGVDEVGRGPLIGDVVAAAVILPDGCELGLMDSKKLSESKRDLLAVEIKEQAIAYAICSASPDEIDELNILHATMLAMRRAVEEVVKQAGDVSLVLVDGNRCPHIPYPCEAIVKGDDKVAEISAASILAKVHRDEQMLELDKLYPEYGFAQHKGYPTSSHLAAIERLGIIPGYRKSFKPIKRILDLL
ncbi:ribonuclease HII [Thiomicrorhabdus sp. ZW0627]|uniref:ribonuclease HII n=1 Tax=Thiomicrorhabdus sp. ZW0627 TaxID=3039774 RepID=UPI00243686C2|nr:ribonuclease HII [Thiomicrorhabdus sp. ZW0627]MDG6772991.1 ribonuclease HII [Thiomicrorhabdus sp. ZW0627]